ERWNRGRTMPLERLELLEPWNLRSLRGGEITRPRGHLPTRVFQGDLDVVPTLSRDARRRISQEIPRAQLVERLAEELTQIARGLRKPSPSAAGISQQAKKSRGPHLGSSRAHPLIG